MKNLFFRGPIQIGKSTYLRNYINQYTDRTLGMCGQRVIENEEIVGYQAKFIQMEKLPPVNIEYNSLLENIFIFKDSADEAILKSMIGKISNALYDHTYDIIILDEIGGFELKSPEMMQGLEKILQSNIPCVGTLKSYSLPKGSQGMKRDYQEEYEYFSSLITEKGKIYDVDASCLFEIDEQLELLTGDIHHGSN